MRLHSRFVSSILLDAYGVALLLCRKLRRLVFEQKLGARCVFRSIPDPARRGIRLSQLLTLEAFIETHADGDGILQGCRQGSEFAP